MSKDSLNTRVTILGSGTCVPSIQRSACSVLVTVAGQHVVLDAGPGTMRRLLETGVSIFDVDFLLFSHFHPDHTSEFVPFVFATKYPDGNRRTSPLTVISGKGFNAFYSGLKAVFGDWIELGSEQFRIIERNIDGYDRLEQGAWVLETLPMEHRDESLGFRITDPAGRSVVYSGDTDACENLVTLSRDADLLICESAMPDGQKVPGHLTPSMAGDIARKAGVNKLVLTHFYPECDEVDVVAQARRTFDGDIVAAQDLMTFDLG